MTTWHDHNDENYKDFQQYGYSHDTAYGYDGNDKIYGWEGNDTFYGLTGSDRLYGEDHNDKLYGGDHNDHLYGGKHNDKLYGGNHNDKLYGEFGSDELWGGKGVDHLYGGSDTGDHFVFAVKDTGSYSHNKADTIHDFQASDQIWLEGSYDYAGADHTPDNGEYSVWKKGSDWVVTYNSHSDGGYHDIIVKGENPIGDISFF